MEKIDLPSGGWVQLLDPNKITERHRRIVRTAMIGLSPETLHLLENPKVTPMQIAEIITRDDANVMFEINDAIAAAIIVDWSFDLPRPPLKADQVADLEGGDYDEVLNAAAPYAPAFFGVKFAPALERDSPS